jgi:hypothetical protein
VVMAQERAQGCFLPAVDGGAKKPANHVGVQVLAPSPKA